MRVKDAGFPFRPESVTDALLIQCGEKAAFAFVATEEREDGRWHAVGNAVLRCPGVLQIRYGHPNDEAYTGHPLYESGLDSVTIAEVEDSDWIREVAAVNDRAFPGTESMFTRIRHHIFPFKECTLEVLWCDFEYEISDKSYEELGADLAAWASRC
ncbi:MAG: hypothetical protein P1U89_27105 [Verrucomicrobiales bacterium]|nr:hypothetical protein [Verrucomicrobiales bacterium]